MYVEISCTLSVTNSGDVRIRHEVPDAADEMERVSTFGVPNAHRLTDADRKQICDALAGFVIDRYQLAAKTAAEKAREGAAKKGS
jgi:hypothetical protein